VDFDPTAAIGIASNGANFYTSTDLGNNWSFVSAIPAGDERLGLGSRPVVAAPFPGTFIAGANLTAQVELRRYGQIMASTDGGATWVDKTGNLYEIGAADTVGTNGLKCMQIEFFYV